MELDDQIDRLRAETPGCRELIHFNNAGFALSPAPVTESVIGHLQNEQELGGYEAAELANAGIENFYDAIGQLLNCGRHEVAYIENATRAWDMAFYAIPFKRGDRVIAAQSEYASNYLAMLQLSRRLGIEIEVVPNTPAGTVCLDTLRQKIDSRTRLIALTHVPSQVGTIEPAEAVGEIAREHGILYLLDACQSAGQIPLDVRQLNCDMLTGTGRKYLRGPRGTGFLYVREEILDRLEPPFVDLHSATWTAENSFEYRQDARRFENWECFVAGKLGLGLAVDYAVEIGLDRIQARIRALATQLVGSLHGIKGLLVHERDDNLSGIVTFHSEDETPEALQARLRHAGINTSASRRVNSRLDLGRRNLEAVNRASLHYYNTRAEIERFIEVLTE